MNSKHASEITIIGAGLVGSLWAIMLRQLGYPVHIFEKRADIRVLRKVDARSINLIITSRGIHALKRVGLFAQAEALAVPVYGRYIHDREGQVTYQPYGQKDEYNLSISRHELNKMLLNEAIKQGAKVDFEYPLVGADFAHQSLVFQTGNDNKYIPYKVVFGSDGAGSDLRNALLQSSRDFQESIDWLEVDYVELHIPALPNGKPALAHNGLHIWPRGHHMMMALANADNSFTVTLYLPKDANLPDGSRCTESFPHLNTPELVRDYFAREFCDAPEIMPHYLEDFLKNPRGRLGTVRFSPWIGRSIESVHTSKGYESKIDTNTPFTAALVGDAAHAIVPFFGQGMNSGFEDLSVLYELFAQYKPATAFDISDILAKYYVTQKVNADAIAKMAVENWHEMSKRVAEPEFLLRKKIEVELENRFPEKYKSRYGMVTYTLIPFSTIYEIGEKQNQILDQLIQHLKSVWSAADWQRHLSEKNFPNLLERLDWDLAKEPVSSLVKKEI